jgi:hypothetical protein
MLSHGVKPLSPGVNPAKKSPSWGISPHPPCFGFIISSQRLPMECFELPAKARPLALIGFVFSQPKTAQIFIIPFHIDTYIHLTLHKLALFFQIGS